MIPLGFTYIVCNVARTTFYTGVTNNLVRRIEEHRKNIGSAFTRRYNLHILVYYEVCQSILEAIVREKQIKDLNRKEKLALIASKNPDLRDLFIEIKGMR